MKILILLLLLIGTPVFGETAWYATPVSINISCQGSSSISTRTYKGSADIIWNAARSSMEFEFTGSPTGTSTLQWASSIYVYCAYVPTVLVAGYQRAVMLCQIWDETLTEIGQGALTFKAKYYSTYDKWIVTETRYYGNGYGLIKNLNTIDQFSVSLTLIK